MVDDITLTDKEEEGLYPQQKEILLEFKRELTLKNNSERTQRVYGLYVKKFLNHTPIKRPNQATDEDVKSFLAKESQGNIVCRAALKAFFKLDRIELKYPTMTGRKTPFRTFCPRIYFDEAMALIRNKDDRLMVKIAYTLAMRNSEVVNSKCKDWHPITKTISIHGKGNKLRVIPVPKTLMSEVQNYMRVHKISSEHDDFLFPFIQCYKHPDQHFRDVLKKVGKKLGEFYSPHALRRGRADELRQLGSDILDLKDLLGHKDVQTTTIYLRSSGKKMREMLESTEKQEDKNEESKQKESEEKEIQSGSDGGLQETKKEVAVENPEGS